MRFGARGAGVSAVAGERPILFSSPMVRAILAGKKSQTRRIVKPVFHKGTILKYAGDSEYLAGKTTDSSDVVRLFCPYGKPGDTLWVRETWRSSASDPKYVHFAADLDAYDREEKGPWRPSIFMPRWASRLTLRSTSVRVEHLQDITDADAEAEGIQRNPLGTYWCGAPHKTHGMPTQWDTAREAFASLWDDINGDRAAWALNPWVWVVSFERVSP